LRFPTFDFLEDNCTFIEYIHIYSQEDMQQDLEKNYKPVRFSRTTLNELMIPAYANFGGKIHGGILLSLMDKVAYACAYKHAGTYCVTVAVNRVEFLEPVEVGEMVNMLASVNYVGKSSMVVGIKVITENFKTGTTKHTNSSYFTMVAKDDEGRPSTVPGLLLETHDDVRRYLKAIRLRTLRQHIRTELDKVDQHIDYSQLDTLLAEERCQLQLKTE
jgi:uncharacterized protein (TIGR00369 family)